LGLEHPSIKSLPLARSRPEGQVRSEVIGLTAKTCENRVTSGRLPGLSLRWRVQSRIVTPANTACSTALSRRYFASRRSSVRFRSAPPFPPWLSNRQLRVGEGTERLAAISFRYAVPPKARRCSSVTGSVRSGPPGQPPEARETDESIGHSHKGESALTEQVSDTQPAIAEPETGYARVNRLQLRGGDVNGDFFGVPASQFGGVPGHHALLRDGPHRACSGRRDYLPRHTRDRFVTPVIISALPGAERVDRVH